MSVNFDFSKAENNYAYIMHVEINAFLSRYCKIQALILTDTVCT